MSELTDAQWEILEPLLPVYEREPGKAGRPRVDNRKVLMGILWVLRTGAPWKDLPGRYGSYQTCHRRYQEWVEDGVIDKILISLVEDLERSGQLDLTESFIDGTFSSAKKRGLGVGKTKRGKGTKIMAITDGNGLPIAVSFESASPHEVKLVEATLDETLTSEYPAKLIGDKAYDSDTLDEQIYEQYGVEMVAPHKANRKKAATQDGRTLRRYKRRWKVERLFAWLQQFRRIVTRWEFKLENFAGFVKLGMMKILLRQF